ncbi:Polycomb-like protein [Globisporangium polare]
MVKVDDDGVILLDDSSEEESEEEEVRKPRSRPAPAASFSGGGSLKARTIQSARKSAGFPSVKKKSAPVAARKAAPQPGYDSDEHLQYVIREIISSSDGGDNDDEEEDEYDDGDASFDESTAFGRRSSKRKRSSEKKRSSRPIVRAGGVTQTHRKSEYLKPAKKARTVTSSHSHSSSSRKHSSTASSKAHSRQYVSEEEDDSSGSDELVDAPRVESSQVSKKKALQQRARRASPPPSSSESEPPVRPKKVSRSQTAAPAGALPRKTEYINVLSGSSDELSSSSVSEEEEVVRKKKKKQQQQKSLTSSAFDRARSSSTSRPNHQTARKAAVSELPKESLSRTNGSVATSTAATTSSAVYRRTDRDFHRLTEKLSYNELQAQRLAFEQISLMHKRSGGGGGFTSPPPAQAARQKPTTLRLESRKTVVKQSRVDEIEKRATATANNDATRAKPVQQQPTIFVAPPSREVVIPTTMPPSSISSTTTTSSTTITTSRATTTLKSLSSNRSTVPPPAMHTTAWRRLRLRRAPPNILSPEAKYPVPFSDEFDRPLPDFDPTGTLEAKTRILASFGQAQKITEATFTGESITQDDMNAKVQDLIADALPLITECQQRRVKSILRGTREHLQSYLQEHGRMRSNLLRYAIPHSTFDLTCSERISARRLFENRSHHAPKLNSLVGSVRYFVSQNDDEDPESASDRAVFPETVVHLNDDIPAMCKSWAYVGVKKNVHVADDPILRYIPYLGENTRVNIDPNRYSSTTMDKSKRVEVLGSKKGSVLELKSVVTSALDDELMECLLRFVVLQCGDSKKVFEALQHSEKFSQPYSDYCEIKKNDDADRRVLKRVTGMQTLMADTPQEDSATCAAEIRQYLRALGGSCWFLQLRPERQGLAHRLKPPIPFFESNYSRFSRGGGLRKTKIYSDSTEWFRDLFCRRCYTYDCDEHGILQPTPLRRTDPINPVVRRAGLALRDQHQIIDVNGDGAVTGDQKDSSGVIELDDSSSDDESVENETHPSASDDESAVRRRSRRSQTRISTLASASLKVQEEMQEKERRRQRRAEAKQLKQLTRAVDDSEYLDDSYLDTVMGAVQSLLSKKASCSDTCWKKHQKAEESSTGADSAAAKPSTTTAAHTATAVAKVALHSFNEAEVLLIRKLSSTLGDNSCLIAAMLKSSTCTCLQVSQFLAQEQKARLSKDGEEDEEDARHRSLSADMSNRRRQKNDWRSNRSHSYSGNRELLKRTRAQRNHDKGNKHSYQPCNHEGICDGCECMKRDHNCDRACACSRDCPNRFQGCKCSMGNCRTKSCPCYGAGRECDPDYCFSCGASDAAVLVLGSAANLAERRLNYDLGICCNANLLRGAQRKMGISFSTTHGWGAFALEPIRKGEFLYEYTGALISDDEAERRGNIYDVMAISFLFDVNSDEVVDATRKGNKSKFANHKALEAANCEAKILLVNGEHRIALYAREDIRVGEELFFDYGYTHETAPQWSQVKQLRNGQRLEMRSRGNHGMTMDLFEDFEDDEDDDEEDNDDSD